MNTKKIILNVGSGKSSVKKWTSSFDDWTEIRADIADVNPDIVTDITTLVGVEDNSVDAIWASHVIEHCHWHEQPMIFQSFLRVLKKDGFAIIKVPDIGSIAKYIEEDLLTPIYKLDNGEFITALDMLFGYRNQLDPKNHDHNPAMAHKMAFNVKLFGQILQHYNLQGALNTTNHEITVIFWKGETRPEFLNFIKL